MNDVLTIILGGGRGTRLFPLTHQRSKPAVPIGGKYRLIDIALSNCLHAGLKRIYVLTQFNSASLNRHIAQTYRLDLFSGGFVEVLAAEQTPEGEQWFQGTADAVRQAARHFRDLEAEYYLILAGDHVYRMDLAELVEAHIDRDADITIATEDVKRAEEKLNWSRRLHEQRYLSLVDLQADELAHKKAKLELELAENRKKVLQEFSHKRDLEALESAVGQARMALDRVTRSLRAVRTGSRE